MGLDERLLADVTQSVKGRVVLDDMEQLVRRRAEDEILQSEFDEHLAQALLHSRLCGDLDDRAGLSGGIVEVLGAHLAAE